MDLKSNQNVNNISIAMIVFICKTSFIAVYKHEEIAMIDYNGVNMFS